MGCCEEAEMSKPWWTAYGPGVRARIAVHLARAQSGATLSRHARQKIEVAAAVSRRHARKQYKGDFASIRTMERRHARQMKMVSSMKEEIQRLTRMVVDLRGSLG
jgi:hypothetical protein